MSKNSLRPNVQDLRKDALELIDKIDELTSDVSQIMADDDSGKKNKDVKTFQKKHNEFQKEFPGIKNNVENLELVMAIVAPMKAGKSTIINAIIGQDVLPSRASAMTTLPTRIRLNSNADEPILELDSETFSRTLSKLQEKIRLDGEDSAVDATARYPHLSELIPKIKRGFQIRSKTTGVENIKETLTNLNDMVRLCTVLDPQSNPFEQEDFNTPCISTPFWKATDKSYAKLLGNLVIVDTPGQNEALKSRSLSMVVEEQLRKSSMVLIVLDFTQLNNKAAEEIKHQVKPVVQLLGKENLYVLINKVDQRTEHDPMTSENVKEFVKADLDLGDPGDSERVFEIAARRAFCATNFLSEIQHNPGIAKDDMKTAKALAEQVLGIDWEDDFNVCSLEQLQNKAYKLRDKSGFEPFLDNAISILMENAAPRSIKSSLKRSQSYLEAVKGYVNIRSAALSADEETLRKDIGALDKDLNDLELKRKELKKVDDIKNELQKKLFALLEVLKKEARISLEDYFFKKDYEDASSGQKVNIATREKIASIPGSLDNVRKKFQINLGFIEPFAASIARNFQSLREIKSSDIFEFDNEYEAEKFANQAVAYAQQRVDYLLVAARETASQDVERAHQDLKHFLDKEISPILEKARARLNKSFGVTLSIPNLILDVSDDGFIRRPQIARKTREVDQGYEEIKVRRKDILSLFGLLPIYINKKIKLPNKEEAYYSVSLNDLIPEVNRSIESRIADIEKNLGAYLDDDFQEKMGQFKVEVQHLLKSACSHGSNTKPMKETYSLLCCAVPCSWLWS